MCFVEAQSFEKPNQSLHQKSKFLETPEKSGQTFKNVDVSSMPKKWISVQMQKSGKFWSKVKQKKLITDGIQIIICADKTQIFQIF